MKNCKNYEKYCLAKKMESKKDITKSTSCVSKVRLNESQPSKPNLVKVKKELKNNLFKSLKPSVFLGLFAWFLITLSTKELFFSGIIGIGVTIFSLVLISVLPLQKERKRLKIIESELPEFLIRLSYELQTGKNIIESIKAAYDENEIISKEYLRLANEIEKGASFETALENINNRINSREIKRVSSNLWIIYTQGNKDSFVLKRLSKDLLAKQRIQSKEFSGKIVLFSLVFISVSAIIPAMFQSFIIIGSYFMSVQFSPTQVLFIIIFLFPAIDVLILLIIEKKTPLFLKG